MRYSPATATRSRQPIGDSGHAIERIHRYVENVAVQNRMAEDVMRNNRIESTEEIYLPVVVLSSSSELSAETVDFRTPKCGNAAIDDAVSSAVRDGAFRAVHEMEWTDPGEMERKAVEADYTTLLAGWNAPERVKKLALELFRNSALQHFKSGQV